MRDINLDDSHFHYQRAAPESTNDAVTLPGATRPHQTSTLVVLNTAVTEPPTLDGIHHMAAQLSTTQPPPSSTTLPLIATSPPPEVGATPLGQVVTTKPEEAPLSTTSPSTAQPTAAGQQAQHYSNQQAEQGRAAVEQISGRFTMGSGTLSRDQLTTGFGVGLNGPVPGHFSGATGPYMGGGELRQGEAGHIGRVEQSYQAVADSNVARGAQARGDTATTTEILRGNPNVGVSVDGGAPVYGESAVQAVVAEATQRAINDGRWSEAATLLRENPQVGVSIGGGAVVYGAAAAAAVEGRGSAQGGGGGSLLAGGVEVNLGKVELPGELPPGIATATRPYVDVAELGEPPLHGTPTSGQASTSGQRIAVRDGVDYAAQRQAALHRQATNLVEITAQDEPLLPPLTAESLRQFNGGSVHVPVRTANTPQMVGVRQLQMTVAAVGRGGRLTVEEQQAFVERWREAAGEGLYHYAADGTRRPLTAEEFGALQREGSTLLELRGEWQPGMVEDLRRMLRDSEPVSVTTTALRMTDEERVAAGRREATQQLADLYRIQANVGIGAVNSTLQLLAMQPEHVPGMRTADGQRVANSGVVLQLPYLELQSEYFRGERGEIIQARATIGAGLIIGGGAARPSAPSITAEAQVSRLIRQRGITGAGSVDEVDRVAEAAYERIRAMSGDVQAISRNTGVPEQVVNSVRQHLFFDEHLLEPMQGTFVRQRFDALPVIADLWTSAVNGTLSRREIQEFERLMAHEYVERGLMRTGMPYRSSHPDAWVTGSNHGVPSAYGAHDLAPLVDSSRPPFSHWPRVIGISPEQR